MTNAIFGWPSISKYIHRWMFDTIDVPVRFPSKTIRVPQSRVIVSKCPLSSLYCIYLSIYLIICWCLRRNSPSIHSFIHHIFMSFFILLPTILTNWSNITNAHKPSHLYAQYQQRNATHSREKNSYFQLCM